MLRILERLNRSFTWQLLAPVSDLPPGLACRRTDDHAVRLAALQSARAAVFGVDDRAVVPDDRTTDARACHFVALDRQGQVAGAVRVFVVDRRRQALDARLLAAFGHIVFPAPDVERHQLSALDRWLAQEARDQVFVYAGGFFTAERWRGMGLAAALGMGAVALARLHGCRHSASFASIRGQAPALFAMLGAQPLEASPGQALEPFEPAHFGIPVRLVTFDTQRPDPSIELAVRAMVQTLRGMTAVVPGPVCTLDAELAPTSSSEWSLA